MNKKTEIANSKSLEENISQRAKIPYFKIKSRKSFNKLLQDFDVKKMKKYYGWASCKYCVKDFEIDLAEQINQKSAEVNASRGSPKKEHQKELGKLKKKQAKLEQHKILVETQKAFEKKVHEEMESEENESVIIHMDFSAYYFSVGKGDFEIINDFILTLDWFDGNEWHRLYFDYFMR